MSSQVFSAEKYATGLGQVLRRGLQPGPKYYIVDVPRYLNRHRKLGLNVVYDDYAGLCDLGSRLAIDPALTGKVERLWPLAECSVYLTV